MLPSIIKENFITAEEIDKISNIVFSTAEPWIDINDGRHTSTYYVWSYYAKEFAEIRQILDNRIRSTTGIDMVIDHSHITHSIEPYKIHSDYYQKKILPAKLMPAYTFIIPLADCESHTLAFNEASEIKTPDEYIKQYNLVPLPKDQQISQDVYDRYLTHCDKDLMQYLSLKEIFPWRAGSFYACDRKHFHCSDNYYKNNLKEKRAIVIWTSTKL